MLVTVWAMKTLNEAIMGSGENTLLIGSSPVVGTTLQFLTRRDTGCQTVTFPLYSQVFYRLQTP
jgi:hypothetical protein